LHVHLSDTAVRTRSGLVRPEYGTANTLHQLREWLTDTGCPVTVQPVLDPADVAPVDAYGGCQDFCVNGVDLVIGAGSSAVDDVPVLTAVKPWSVGATGWAG